MKRASRESVSRVLAAVEAHPGATVPTLRAVAGLSGETISRALTELRDRGDVAPMGALVPTGRRPAEPVVHARDVLAAAAAEPVTSDELSRRWGLVRVRAIVAELRDLGALHPGWGVWPVSHWPVARGVAA